jgi:hypothetical protein
MNKSIEETAEAYALAFAKLRAEMARLQGSLSTCKDLLDANREWLDRAELRAEYAADPNASLLTLAAKYGISVSTAGRMIRS